MLRDDNASGELREPQGSKLLVFPGNTKQLDEEYGPFNEEGHISRLLITSPDSILNRASPNAAKMPSFGWSMRMFRSAR